MDMLNRAVSSGASLDMVEKLMTLQERWEANQARKAFDNAMAAAKAEIPNITKNREVDFTSQKGRTHYRYEDLGEIARVVSPILAKHGLSYRYRTTSPSMSPSPSPASYHIATGISRKTRSAPAATRAATRTAFRRSDQRHLFAADDAQGRAGPAVSNDDDGKKGGRRRRDHP
jgi:hypothetical protein